MKFEMAGSVSAWLDLRNTKRRVNELDVSTMASTSVLFRRSSHPATPVLLVETDIVICNPEATITDLTAFLRPVLARPLCFMK